MVAEGDRVRCPRRPNQSVQSAKSVVPRPLVPLTMSPQNHRLWNPPAADALGSRVVERDESGRLAKFANRFSGATSAVEETAEAEGGKLFAPEADLSFLEGETLQSPSKGLGKRDIMSVSTTSPLDRRRKTLLIHSICFNLQWKGYNNQKRKEIE